MAELKGLVLSLSQIYQSPRQLLIEVNRIISDNLDSRSFITMTYAVIDLGAGTMTYARAGHTPLIYMPAAGVAGQGRAGPGAERHGGRPAHRRRAEKFNELLEEETVDLDTGDVIVLYTDGITEAMNARRATCSATPASAGSSKSTATSSRASCASGSCARSRRSSARADQHDDMTMILMKVEQPVAARIAV